MAWLELAFDKGHRAARGTARQKRQQQGRQAAARQPVRKVHALHPVDPNRHADSITRTRGLPRESATPARHRLALLRRPPQPVPLANELARVGGGDWDVTAVAPRFSHGDLSPLTLKDEPGEPARMKDVRALFSRSPHAFVYGLELHAPLRRRGPGALVGGAVRRALVHGR